MKQIEIETELKKLTAEIAETREEIGYQEDCHAEAPHRSDYSDMTFGDQMSALEGKLEKLLTRKDELEDMLPDEEFEIEAPVNVPKVAPNKVALFATYTVAAFGFIAVGLLLAVAIVLDDKDLLWNNTESFWKQII